MKWHFHLDDNGQAYQKDFDDSEWRRLNLPHDWSIEGEYDQDNPVGISGAFLPTGIGWYRKDFQYQTSWNNKRVYVLFDGVYMNSTVYINGKKLGTRPYGYIGFQYDLTNYLVSGENTIAVKVDHSKAPSGIWYTGSGTYRHVNLLVTNQLHLSRHGVQVNAGLKDLKMAFAKITSTIENHKSEPQWVRLQQTLKDKDGNIVKTQESVEIKIDSKNEITQQIELENPLLWSAKTPKNRYFLETKVLDKNGNTIDQILNTIGFRKIIVSVEKGLLVNGKKQ